MHSCTLRLARHSMREREKVKSDLVGIRLDFYRWRARGRRGPVVPAARVAASGVPRFLGVVFLAGSLRRFSRLFLRVSGKNQNKQTHKLVSWGKNKKKYSSTYVYNYFKFFDDKLKTFMHEMSLFFI